MLFLTGFLFVVGRRSLMTLLVSAIAATSFGAVATSASYSLDYAVPAGSGGATSSAAYSVLVQVQTHGVVSQTVSGGAYSIQPIIGTTGPTAAVTDWEVY